MLITSIVGGILLVLAAIVIITAIFLRRVVSTNEVHIVQSGKKTISYGKDLPDGNVYYAWPSFLPKIGVSVSRLPVSVFSCDLTDYEAFDEGRLPFMLDIKAFFRIENSNLAAQRVSSFTELHTQLKGILMGAIRTILAKNNIEAILSGRSEFGEHFTTEVIEQLKSWGVTTVKSIELMDIRDSANSKVIANIMEKKKSEIDKESRTAVAANRKAAELAEIEARREVELGQQQAAQQVGVRTAEAEREVALARERQAQLVAEQAAITAGKTADVQRVKVVKQAEIERDRAVVDADAEAQAKIRIAEGDLRRTELQAAGVKATGEATAEAEKLMQLAPVQAQITLAQEIGENQGYQQYLVTLRQVEANQVIGVAQADALKAAGIKVIATGGTATEGVNSIGQLFSAGGGVKLGAALEGLANTDQGKALLTAIGVTRPEPHADVPHVPPTPTQPRHNRHPKAQ